MRAKGGDSDGDGGVRENDTGRASFRRSSWGHRSGEEELS